LQSLVESLHSVGVHVSYLPEFFREGVANEDIRNGQIVVGAQSNLVLEQLALILGDRPLQVCRMGEAVVLKLASNAWHGLKVAFSNEVHQVCNGLGEMSDRVMELFCLDRRLNISDSYLQPGPPFGGYCLQKDIEFISRKHSGLPVIGGIVASNNDVIDRITTRLMSSGFKKIFWYGNSFKPGTDDSRNSISLTISDKLKAESIEVVFVEALPIQDVTQAEQTLLVLGPRELSDEDYEWIMLNQLNVFDLGYFAATRSNFKSYAKYESY
jgi:GDP-mannose 6-dehydrogenase